MDTGSLSQGRGEEGVPIRAPPSCLTAPCLYSEVGSRVATPTSHWSSGSHKPPGTPHLAGGGGREGTVLAPAVSNWGGALGLRKATHSPPRRRKASAPSRSQRPRAVLWAVLGLGHSTRLIRVVAPAGTGQAPSPRALAVPMAPSGESLSDRARPGYCVTAPPRPAARWGAGGDPRGPKAALLKVVGPDVSRSLESRDSGIQDTDQAAPAQVLSALRRGAPPATWDPVSTRGNILHLSGRDSEETWDTRTPRWEPERR